MTDRPTPPDGFETWLDAAIECFYLANPRGSEAARTELAALRAKLAAATNMLREVVFADDPIKGERWCLKCGDTLPNHFEDCPAALLLAAIDKE